VAPQELDASAIVSHAKGLIENRSEAKQRFSQAVQTLKGRALLNIAPLTAGNDRQLVQSAPNLSFPSNS
jgi:hypothetical protein